jgi:protein O-GlcNAc transferase
MLGSFLQKLFGKRASPAPAPVIAPTLESAYALMREGKTADAVITFEALLKSLPATPALLNDLGICYVQLGCDGDAKRVLNQALILDSNSTATLTNIGNLFLKLNNPEEAAEHYRRALAHSPDSAWLWHHLAISQSGAGRADESLASSRRALQLAPNDPAIRSNLLFTMVLAPAATARDLYDETRRWAALGAEPLTAQAAPNTNDPDPERVLRIAYVSADLRTHPIASYIEPLLARHDAARFKVHCYANHAMEDEYSARLKSLSHAWLNVAALSDEAFAAQVRKDGIDLLIDLSGHTYGNRMLSLARKPAPLQFTWLGFAASTGMSAMDYRLTDNQFDPPELGDELFTEKLLRLPDCLWCYRPLGEFETPSETPALKNGYITLGSLNGFHKTHPALLADWAALMQKLPHSRLLMVTVPEGKTRDRVIDTFAAAGIASDRIDIRDRLASREFRALHAECDIALDAFPCGGGATTCEVLWMGIPVITRRGDTSVSRAGSSLLRTVGLPELVAHDRDSFIAIASTLAASPDRIAALRSGMRERMKTSPLMQEESFTRSLEALYRQAWRDWCENRRGAK